MMEDPSITVQEEVNESRMRDVVTNRFGELGCRVIEDLTDHPVSHDRSWLDDKIENESSWTRRDVLTTCIDGFLELKGSYSRCEQLGLLGCVRELMGDEFDPDSNIELGKLVVVVGKFKESKDVDKRLIGHYLWMEFMTNRNLGETILDTEDALDLDWKGTDRLVMVKYLIDLIRGFEIRPKITWGASSAQSVPDDGMKFIRIDHLSQPCLDALLKRVCSDRLTERHRLAFVATISFGRYLRGLSDDNLWLMIRLLPFTGWGIATMMPAVLSIIPEVTLQDGYRKYAARQAETRQIVSDIVYHSTILPRVLVEMVVDYLLA